MKLYCLTLDLKDDVNLIDEYILLHQDVWPEVKASIEEAGIIDMKIYRYMDRLVMIMDVDKTFDFERKAQIDSQNPKVQEWESLMSKYQKQIKGTEPTEKWVLMDEIFSLQPSHNKVLIDSESAIGSNGSER